MADINWLVDVQRAGTNKGDVVTVVADEAANYDDIRASAVKLAIADEGIVGSKPSHFDAHNVRPFIPDDDEPSA